jgi:hypothetical protein
MSFQHHLRVVRVAAFGFAFFLTGALRSAAFAGDCIGCIVQEVSGNVGIGTTVPGALLHVSGGNVLVDNAHIYEGKDSGGTIRTLLQLYSNNITYLDGGASGLQIRTNNATTNALKVDSTGNVGIGTTGPSATLDVRGLIAGNGHISNGTTFTIASGCGTPGSLTGGATTGSFTAGQAACAPVINLPTAPNGWWCSANDITHPADAFTQTAKSTTSCTLSATVTSADVIVFHAEAY